MCWSVTSLLVKCLLIHFVSIELFIFAFLIYESYMLNTLCTFLEKKSEGAVAFLLFVLHPYHSLEIAAVNLGKKKKKKKEVDLSTV